MFDCAIIGGGIVGLATAMTLCRRDPNAKVIVFEKEEELACHQSGRNSGVIHSGIYYKPGSLKAQFAREGSRTMVEFCKEHGIRHEVCGKVIVATEERHLPLLEKLFQRGLENELPINRLIPEEVKEIEPRVRCLGGIRVPTTGIAVDEIERNALVEALKMSNWMQKDAAELLAISPRVINYKIKTLRIEFPRGRRAAPIAVAS